MESHFASPERSTGIELQSQIVCVQESPIVNGLMNMVSGLFLVLNEHRQIVALNQSFLHTLGISDAEEILGLRPGESINCIHAAEMPGGCGTSRFCSSCGAAIAIVASLGANRPEERDCAVTVQRDDRQVDLFLKVRSLPIVIEGARFLLLFLQDITKEQQWSTLERVFFHDINNIVFALMGKSETLADDSPGNRSAREMYELTMRLAREVEIQRTLFQTGIATYRPILREVSVSEVIAEITQTFSNHGTSRHKTVVYPTNHGTLRLKTDLSLLLRILENMITNALEATLEGGRVEIRCEPRDSRITFSVWNAQAIQEDIRLRIFQRNITTKPGPGRGLGAYSIKLFGEGVLGGTVAFTTSEETGTVFSLTLPLH